MNQFARRLKKISEDDVEQYLVDEIQKLGGKCLKGNPHNQRGMPDRICILPTRITIYVECKRPGRKPRPNQKHTLQEFSRMGHHAVYVATFSMVDNLIAWCRVQLQKRRKK